MADDLCQCGHPAVTMSGMDFCCACKNATRECRCTRIGDAPFMRLTDPSMPLKGWHEVDNGMV
jgi:hypothetical protein